MQGKQPKALREANRGQRELAACRRARALELRCQHLTFRQIARELRVSVKTAYNYVEGAMHEVHCATRERVEMLREMQLEALGDMQFRWLPLAVSPRLEVGTGEGDGFRVQMADYKAGLKAAGICLKIMERRAKLLGLDASVEKQRTQRPKPACRHMTLAEFEERMAKAKAARAKAEARDGRHRGICRPGPSNAV